MKTQIIQLEAHDDVISARDKMGWAKTSRILLVWPARGRVLRRRLDLELLQRRSNALGAQLALVTRDAEVRANARTVGIPLFKNERKAQQNYWRRPRHRKKVARKSEGTRDLLFEATGYESEASEEYPETTPERLERPSKKPIPLPKAARFGFFSLGVLAFLSIAAVLYPSAKIDLAPEIQTQTILISVQASEGVDRVNLSGLVPINEVTVIVEGSQNLTPTGSSRTPLGTARGIVRFTNLTDRTISVPAGTILTTPGAAMRFATQRDGQVQPDADAYLDLPVIALTPGSAGNLAADRLQIIQDELGASLTVTNPQPTRGGSDRPSLAATALDRSRLKNLLTPSLVEAALREINAELTSGDMLLSPEPELVNTVSEEFDPPDDQPASILNLTLVQEYRAAIISGQDLRELASAVLDANLLDGYAPVPGSLQLEQLDKPLLGEDGAAAWRMRAEQQVRAQISPTHTANLSLGLTPAMAGERLKANLPLEFSPQIDLNPAWWPRLPVLPFRIQVTTVDNP